MLIKKINKDIFYNKLSDKSKINDVLLEYYDYKNNQNKKETKLKDKELELDDFVDEKNLTFKQLKNILNKHSQVSSLLDVISYNKLQSIFKNNKYTKEELNELVQLIKENPKKLKRINLNTSQINFSEENLKDLIEAKVWSRMDIISVFKNIDNIIENNDKMGSPLNTFLEGLLHNSVYFTIDKVKEVFDKEVFIEKNEDGEYVYKSVIDKMDKIDIQKWLTGVPISVELIEKYPQIFTKDIVLKSDYKNEEIIKKFLSKEEGLYVSKGITLSKFFLKKSIQRNYKHISPNNVFIHLDGDEKDIEEILFVFLESIEKTLKKNYVDKTEEEKRQIYLPNLNNAFKNLLIKINDSRKKDMEFYLNLKTKYEEKYKVNLDYTFSEYAYLFNENTKREYFSLLEDLLKKPKDINDYDVVVRSIKNESDSYELTNALNHLLKYTNIPEDFLITYMPYFSSNFKNSKLDTKSFDTIISNQILPRKSEKFDRENFIINNFDITTIMCFLSVLETKEEAEDMKLLLQRKDEIVKHHFSEESYNRFLFNNTGYLMSLSYKEAKELFEKSDLGRTKNNYEMLAVLKLLEDEMFLKRKNELKEFQKNMSNDFGMFF